MRWNQFVAASPSFDPEVFTVQPENALKTFQYKSPHTSRLSL